MGCWTIRPEELIANILGRSHAIKAPLYPISNDVSPQARLSAPYPDSCSASLFLPGEAPIFSRTLSFQSDPHLFRLEDGSFWYPESAHALLETMFASLCCLEPRSILTFGLSGVSSPLSLSSIHDDSCLAVGVTGLDSNRAVDFSSGPSS